MARDFAQSSSQYLASIDAEIERLQHLRQQGLRYVRGLRATIATDIERVRAMRPFGSIEELARRVPSLSQADLTVLAETGALNSLGERTHRRDALWQVERAARAAGPLFSKLDRMRMRVLHFTS